MSAPGIPGRFHGTFVASPGLRRFPRLGNVRRQAQQCPRGPPVGWSRYELRASRQGACASAIIALLYSMPTMKRFHNCRVVMYPREHSPPHFHVVMNDGRQCLIAIEDLEVLVGAVPARELREAMVWARANTGLLTVTWKDGNP